MTFWIAAALATRWLYFRCFSCSTGSRVSITPSPPKFNHLAKPLYASTLFVVAVMCSLNCALDFTIHVPRPGGPRQCSTRPRSVACTRPPGGQRDAVSRAVPRDNPGDVGGHRRDNGRRGEGRGRR